MKKKLFFTSLIRWLYSTEMFARPSKQLPGRWILFEYYSEPGDQLLNLKEEDLEQAGYYWKIDFEAYGQLRQEMNLPVHFFTDTPVCNWHIASNFLKFSGIETPEKKEEFQFAISRRDLKLLQKDTDGKIIFFGFFRKIEESK